VFTADKCCKDDVVKLLGKIEIQKVEEKNNANERYCDDDIKLPGKVEIQRAEGKKNANKRYCEDDVRLIGKMEMQKAEGKRNANERYCGDDMKLLGKIEIQNAKGKKNAKERPQKKWTTEKESYSLQAHTVSCPGSKNCKSSVPFDGTVCHVSLDILGKLWVSDNNGYLFHTDLQGNRILKIKTSGKSGCHSVTRHGSLIFTNDKTRAIKEARGGVVTEFLKTGTWEPISIHSSHITEDILVGMVKRGEAKITGYNKAGNQVQILQADKKGEALYVCPCYISENRNGDICASDIEKQEVVVVNRSGQYIFSYPGQKPEFAPYGICTDVVCHIIVCDNENSTIDLLDKDGQFLCFTQQEGVYRPRSVCVDNDKLYVGQLKKIVMVYEYPK
jgi:hypothetical protein